MKRLLVSILLMLPFTGWAQTFLPLSTGETVKHTYYTLSYNESKEQANWVYYHLTAADVRGKESRTDDFRPDPEVRTRSASLADYSGSGYDRGHLCPAAAMRSIINRCQKRFTCRTCRRRSRISTGESGRNWKRRYEAGR